MRIKALEWQLSLKKGDREKPKKLYIKAKLQEGAVMKAAEFNRLKEICEIPGVPGHEFLIRKHLMQVIKPYVDSMSIDPLGNLIAFKKGKSRKKLMISAHMDEIGFIVSHIEKEGFIRFKTLGGFDPKTLCSQRVVLYDEKQQIPAVIGCKPIHSMTAAERKNVPELDTFYMDCGLPQKEIEKRISLGMPVARIGPCEKMGEMIVSKSLDNRLCVHVLVEMLRSLKEPAYDTYALFSVQEEVGIRGASVASAAIKPDVGIALDVTLANDLPGISPQDYCTKLGEGVGLKVLDASSIVCRELRLFMESLAKKKKIPMQLEIMQGGGTDTSGLQYRGGHACLAGCLSVPTRYIHSTTESCSAKDVQSTIELLTEVTEKLNLLKVTHLP